MLRRYILRSTRFSVTSSRSYRTKGALGKAKRLEEDEKKDREVPKKSKNEVKASLKSLGKAIIITPGSEQHNDIQSFLDYTQRLKLSETSTVYVGTHYEYTVALSLQNLGFDLTRIGRASDHGIDLLGHWSVPSLPKAIRVLLQCKAHHKGLTPANVRELEGAFPGAPPGWRGGGVMGFLVATNQATKGMRDALIRSHLPMGFLQVTVEGKVLQFVWNHEAAQQGLEGMGVTNRFTPQVEEKGSEGNGLEQEIALTWKGRTLSKEETEVAKMSKTKTKPQSAKSSKTTAATSQAGTTEKSSERKAVLSKFLVTETTKVATKHVANKARKPVQARRKN